MHPRTSAPPRAVLVVDDHSDAVDIFVEVLRDAGFDAYGTTSPNEALSLAVLRHPDALVSDIAMPRMDGCELATLLRSYASTRDIRLIAVSAHSFDFSRYVVPPGGWDACLRKPLDPSTLVETVRTVLGDVAPEHRSESSHRFPTEDSKTGTDAE
jgi:CheY-like chemotaxis protein